MGDGRRLTRRRALGAIGTGVLGSAGALAASAQSADATVSGGGDITGRLQSAIDGLTSGRTSKEWVVVEGGGTISQQISLPSYTGIDVQGTITADGITPFYADRSQSIEIRNLTLEGSPYMGMRLRRSDDVALDGITMNIDEGIGIRIDDGWNDGTPETTTNVQIGSVEITGAGSHGVETYGVDGFEADTVTTQDTGGCGLLLNNTANATVGHVDATRADPGGGYAGFRCANDAGPNVTVDRVDAVGCGRGVFTVSGSGGITIREVNLEDNDGNLIQDTRDLTIEGGTVTGTGGDGFRIDSRSSEDHPHTRNVTIENCAIEDNGGYGVRETGPGTEQNAIRNNAFCNNGNGGVSTFASSTTVSGNSYDCSGDVDTPTDTPCEPTTITPYVRVGDGEWRQTASVSAPSGTEVRFGPQPADGGSWEWSGPGLDADTREATVTAGAFSTYYVTYTNDCGETSSHEFTVAPESDGGDPGPVGDNENAPTDPDGDGLYEDVNGNGDRDLADAVDLYQNRQSSAVTDHVDAYDFSGNDEIDLADVVQLYQENTN